MSNPATIIGVISSIVAIATAVYYAYSHYNSNKPLSSDSDGFQYFDCDSDSKCSICLEDCLQNPSVLECGHRFHENCIQRWLPISEFCPNCKARARII